MIQGIRNLLTNKATVAALVTVIVALGAELGYDVSTERLALILGFGAVLITSFGMASHGSEAARIYADADGDGIPDDEDPTPNGEEPPAA